MDSIESTSFTSDWEFHDAIAKLFARLGDAHTLYRPPSSYTKFHLIRPFFIQSRVVGDQQIVETTGQVFIAQQYSYGDVTGIDASQYVGKRIISINNQPIIDFLKVKFSLLSQTF